MDLMGCFYYLDISGAELGCFSLYHPKGTFSWLLPSPPGVSAFSHQAISGCQHCWASYQIQKRLLAELVASPGLPPAWHTPWVLSNA